MIEEEAKATNAEGTKIVLVIIAMRASVTTESGSLRGKLLKWKSLSIWLRKHKEMFHIFYYFGWIFLYYIVSINFFFFFVALVIFNCAGSKSCKKLKAQRFLLILTIQIHLVTPFSMKSVFL